MSSARQARRSVVGRLSGLANGVLARAGLKLVRAGRAEVVDLRSVTRRPIEAVLRAGAARALIEVPLADCRLLHAAALPCRPNAANPFVDTLRALRAGECRAYEGSPLEAFFARWQPRSACEVLGLTQGSSRGASALHAAPAFAYVLPWDAESPAQALAHRTRMIEASHRRAGERTELAEGWKGWGPVSERVGRLEFARLARVFRSIETHGYRRSSTLDGDIGAFVLCARDECRFLVSPGHHRAAALAALDHETAPVRLFPVLIRREDAAEWPAVRAGIIPLESALAVFDRVFAGRPPWTASGESAPGRASRAPVGPVTGP